MPKPDKSNPGMKLKVLRQSAGADKPFDVAVDQHLLDRVKDLRERAKNAGLVYSIKDRVEEFLQSKLEEARKEIMAIESQGR